MLGVIYSDGAEFVLADIPGLIEGAHEGAGLGARFLGHIERCGVLLHLVDGTGDDLAGAYRTVRGELEAYGGGLAGKTEILVLNKIDALDDELTEAQVAELAAAAGRAPEDILRVSGVTGAGVAKLLRALTAHIKAWREAQGLQPAAKGSAEAQPWEATR